MIRSTAIPVILITAGLALSSPLRAQSESSQDSMPTAELQSLLEKVAANSDKEFLVDSRVDPTVYVGGTPSDNPDYPVLLSILRNNGLVAVEIEGYVNIVPDAIARQLPVPLVQRDDPDIPGDAWVSRVITVPAGDAAHQFVPILRPLLPQQAHLSAYGAGEQYNKLLIVGSYAEVKRITEIVNALTE